MRELPIKFPAFGVQGTEWKCAIVDAGHWNYFGIVSRGEYLVRFFEILICERFLDDRYTGTPQQPDDALASDACEESSVRDGREYYAVFRHEYIRGGELGDIAQHIAHNRVVETSSVHFKKRARIGGIKASGLGIHRHGVERGPAKRRQRN